MRWAPWILSLLSGALYASLFPPLSLHGLAWLTLAPFFGALALLPPARAAACGMLWACTATLGIAWWFPGMLMRYFDAPPVVAALGLAGLAVCLSGLHFAAFGAWLSWSARRGAAGPFVVAAGFVLCEFARSQGPLANPVGLLGYSQVATPFIQAADLAGPYAASWLVAAANAALAALFVPALRARRPRAALVAVAAALCAAWLYGAERLAQRFDAGPPLRVGVVQGAVAREYRFDPAHTAENLQRYLVLTERVAERPLDLVFWPEYAIDFYLREDSLERRELLRAARALGADLVLGGPHYRRDRDRIHYYNSVFLIEAGELADRYDKWRLVPFAEQPMWSPRLGVAEGRYEAGETLRALRGRAAQLGVFLCSEALHPDLVRRIARAGAELLANPSNDYWYGAAAPAQMLLEIAAVRAIENRRWLVRATPTGYSAVIDPQGRVTARSPFGTSDVLVAEVHRSHARTPYQRWGDAPCWAALGVVLIAPWRRREVSR